MTTTRYRLGVDVGGTHTDLVLLDTETGAFLVQKVASTPKNPALGVLDGLARFVARGVAPGEIGFFAHGTTITTNALLEMRGAKVGLIITQGLSRRARNPEPGARRKSVRLFLFETSCHRARGLTQKSPSAATMRAGAPPTR
jgi:hypothetical protein